MKPGENVKVRTRHNTTVETLLTDSHGNVLAITFEDLGARHHETVRVRVGGTESMTVDTLAFGITGRLSMKKCNSRFSSPSRLR